jgi:hypothetical protein
LTGSALSKADPPGVRRPSIDDLVAIAHDAGRLQTSKRTIRHWIEGGLVDGAVRSGRQYGYPLRAIGQVDTLARFPIRKHSLGMVRFALFIETDSGDPAEALRVAATHVDPHRESVAAARKADPEMIHADIKRAARMRAGNSVLPRDVQMSQAERDVAVAQLVQAGLGVRLDGVPTGLGAVERALGLRSGRGGRTRETPLALTQKDLEVLDPDVLYKAAQAATPCHARVARSVVELICLWIPALIPSLLMTSTKAESKFLQVIENKSRELRPEMYVAAFAGLLAKMETVPDERLAEIEKGLRPELAMIEMLATQPVGDLCGVLSRLRPLQRLKLRAAIALVPRTGAK